MAGTAGTTLIISSPRRSELGSEMLLPDLIILLRRRDGPDEGGSAFVVHSCADHPGGERSSERNITVLLVQLLS
jgi:hypothetical protein